MNGILAGRPKKLLVIVNPFGGDRAGTRVYTTTVEPLLKAAGISFTMQGVGSLVLAIAFRLFCWVCEGP